MRRTGLLLGLPLGSVVQEEEEKRGGEKGGEREVKRNKRVLLARSKMKQTETIRKLSIWNYASL